MPCTHTSNSVFVCILTVSLCSLWRYVHARADDGRRVPVFWGYLLVPRVAGLVSSVLDAGRLALVFDLDETLLVANSASQLDNRVEACRKARRAVQKELQDVGEAATAQER